MLSGSFTGKLNIEIIMAPKDEHNVVGHCGKFDGNTLNEFTHKNGGFTTNLPYTTQDPQTFSDSWRIADEENLFLSSDRKLESWNEINYKYCICKRPGESLFETACSYSQFLGCTNGKVLRKCQSVSRVKRSTSIREELERKRMFTLFSQQRTVREKRQVANNITSDEASSLCASLKQSLPLTELADFSGNESAEAVTSQCEFDVVELNDASFVNVHLDAMNGVVKTMLALSPLYVSNNTETVSYFIANSCSMNCSGNGICMANGTCACNGTFRGSDCSIDITQPLTIDDIEGGGVCDIAEGDCQCFTMRTNNLLDNFYCEVDVYQVISNDTDAEKLWSESNAGRYEDLFTGVCCVSYEQLKRTTAYALKYDFALSNDGLNYGSAKTTYVYDSTCEYVNSTSSGELVFAMKDNYCFIGGSCVEANQTDSADECLVCHPENNVLSWTRVCRETEADSKNSYNVVLVIVITSTAVIGLLVIGLAVILVWKFCLKQKINPNSQHDETEPEMATAISRLPVANTAWSRVKYASKPFNQPEKNPFHLSSSEESHTSMSPKWSTISVSSRPSTAASEASIPVSREARRETSGFFKQNLKLETDVNKGPTQKEELTRGVSVINLEFDYGNE